MSANYACQAQYLAQGKRITDAPSSLPRGPVVLLNWEAPPGTLSTLNETVFPTPRYGEACFCPLRTSVFADPTPALLFNVAALAGHSWGKITLFFQDSANWAQSNNCPRVRVTDFIFIDQKTFFYQKHIRREKA